jgi:tRNA dimethylallyltransferase
LGSRDFFMSKHPRRDTFSAGRDTLSLVARRLRRWMSPPPKVLILAGPTAVGKSALALRLCEQLPGELISVDSVQVYRGLQIGSAKPSEEERRRVRHHLLDIRDPADEYTAGSFYRDALHSVQDVLSRGKTPVLVGGTMMYTRWLAHGRPSAPKSDPEVAERARQRLEPFEAAGDWEAGLAVLTELDAAR